ncbi:MAG: NEW3 domain-containing protein [Solirubrobacteraceae bacterium]
MARIGRWTLAARVTIAVVLAWLCAAAPAALASTPRLPSAPVMGWNSWDFMRHDPTEATVQAQATAMVSSGLKSAGYRYVNVDDYWYECPGPTGPTVDRHGRWVVNPANFPSQGSLNGIQATAAYVHHLGLKFGIYVTPGISAQAVAQNSPIAGTHDTARQIATTTHENNYNCGGMVGIDYSRPGAQAFVNSWANELAHWGVDYVKLDGVGRFDIPDIQAWSRALRQTGRPIHLELSNSLSIRAARTWARYAGGWRTGRDIDCYCSTTSYPLTNWANVAARFDSVARWAPYGHPGTFNDYDSIEVGNGALDGLTPVERRTQLSLWALAASPLILGTDLTHLVPFDRSLLLNRSVISVDQDAIDAHRVLRLSTKQVFAKTERSGDVVVGLFNTGSSLAGLSTTVRALGLSGHHEYFVDNLWTHSVTETAGRIAAEVPSHGAALLRITPATRRAVPPLETVGVSGPTNIGGAGTVTERVNFTDAGVQAAHGVHLSLAAPSGWKVSPRSRTSFRSVASGASVSARFRVAVPAAAQPFTAGTLTASAAGTAPRRVVKSFTKVTVTGATVAPPFATYSSARDSSARFSEVGSQFGIEGAGIGLTETKDDYSAIYDPGAVNPTSTVTVEVTGDAGLSGYAKAGIIVRNQVAAAGQAPEGVILAISPSGGIQLQYDDNAGTNIDAVTPPNGRIAVGAPVYLRLVRSGASYTGYYSTDGSTWQQVGSATVPGQAPTQDAGMFVVSQQSGVPGVARFDGFSVG